MLLNEDCSKELLRCFNEFLGFLDVQYYCLKNIYSLLEKQTIWKNNLTSENVFANTHLILQNITNQDGNLDEKELFLDIDTTEMFLVRHGWHCCKYQNCLRTHRK